MESRFFTTADPCTSTVLLPLPTPWWSRQYEYEWALQFAEPGDVALDAACGLGHPLKFALSDLCREVYACDLDPRIGSAAEIRKDLAETFGPEAATGFPERYFERVRLAQASITALPYRDGQFRKVYCISVLEHLKPEDVERSLREFSRVLSDDGLLLLTLDYPSVDLCLLEKALARAGLRFAGPVNYSKPENALYHAQGRLNCFRAVLCKDQPQRVLVASPVRQQPAILEAFLNSVRELEVEGLGVDFYFVDDNEDPRSQALLRAFASERRTVLVPGAPQGRQYVKDETTHRWREDLVWKVAGYKDRMLRHALEQGYDFLFLVDSDLVLHPLTLKQLLAARQDIVSEVFWTKWTPDQPELPQVWLSDHYDLCERRRDERLTPEVTQQRIAAFLRQLHTPGVYEVGGLGACTVISRHAMAQGVSFAEIPNLSFWGEDRHFCIRAQALGLKLHADTHLPPYHIYRETELAGVESYRASWPAMSQQLRLIQAVRAGLDQWGTTDYRSMDGLEGLEHFAPELQAKRRHELGATLKAAQQGQAILRATTGGVRITGITGNRVTALATLVNEGVEQGQAFRNQFEVKVQLSALNGSFRISGLGRV